MDQQIEKDNINSQHYLSLLAYCKLAAIVGIILAATLVYKIFDKKPGVFYASSTSGNVQRLYAVNQPSLTKDYLLKWSEMAVRNSFSLNFGSIQDTLKEIKPDYTPQGFKTFNDALNSSDILSDIKQQKLILSPLVSNDPVILYQGVVHGRYTWRIQMPLLLKYISASDSVQQKRIVTIDVARVSSSSAPKSGVQITNIYVTARQ